MGNCSFSEKHIVNNSNQQYIDNYIFQTQFLHNILSIQPFNPFSKNDIDLDWSKTFCIETLPCRHWVYLHFSNKKPFLCILDSKQIVQWFQLNNLEIPSHFQFYTFGHLKCRFYQQKK